jgi:hypothetical protein
MMEAGAAVIRAGGAGVFIDNCALAHGGEDWIRMAEDGGPDALSFAFVGIVRGREDLWTMGMQVAGLPDIIMRRSELDEDDRAIIEIIRYVFDSDKPIGDGHLLIDELGRRFKARTTCGDKFDPTSPMHNPFGRLRLVSLRDIAKHN